MKSTKNCEHGEPTTTLYPSTSILATVLSEILSGTGRDTISVAIADRRPLSGSTFPVEIVTCHVSDGQDLRLFCKYEAGHSHEDHGHRGGVGYEADVYEQLLVPWGCSSPRFFGRHREDESGDTWLFIEWLDGQSIANTQPPDCIVALRQAAAWIGRFHADFAVPSRQLATLKRYDSRYYRGFVDRLIEYSKDRLQQYPWIMPSCSMSPGVIAHLLAAPTTVVHGEFYPGNVVYDQGRICPVDWESVAVAPGELDFASLTEGWPPAIVMECEEEYAASRWPEGAPSTFRPTVAAARLYWSYRWLGSSWHTFHHNRRSETRLQRMLQNSTTWSALNR